MKNFVFRIIALAFVALGLAVGSASMASAHHNVVSGTPTRPCGADSAWTATAKSESDGDYNKDWRTKYKVDAGAYGAFGAWVDDQVDYGPVNLGPFPASKANVTVTFFSEWGAKSNHNNDTASAENAITINRPAAYACPVVTTTTTTVPATTTTTTVPATTTTTAPATTTTVPVTTTTVVETTTTIPVTNPSVPEETTTTVVETTLPEATTTVVPDTTPAPTTVPFIPVPEAVLQVTELPATGVGSTLFLVAAILIVVGIGFIILGSRKYK